MGTVGAVMVHCLASKPLESSSLCLSLAGVAGIQTQVIPCSQCSKANAFPLSHLPSSNSSDALENSCSKLFYGGWFFSPFLLFLETGSNYVAQMSVRLTVLVPPSPEYLDCRCAPLRLALSVTVSPTFPGLTVHSRRETLSYGNKWTSLMSMHSLAAFRFHRNGNMVV